MLRTYKVSAREWTSSMQEDLGEVDSKIDLTSDFIVELIIKHGRAEIKEIDGDWSIEFQNDYD